MLHNLVAHPSSPPRISCRTNNKYNRTVPMLISTQPCCEFPHCPASCPLSHPTCHARFHIIHGLHRHSTQKCLITPAPAPEAICLLLSSSIAATTLLPPAALVASYGAWGPTDCKLAYLPTYPADALVFPDPDKTALFFLRFPRQALPNHPTAACPAIPIQSAHLDLVHEPHGLHNARQSGPSELNQDSLLLAPLLQASTSQPSPKQPSQTALDSACPPRSRS